MLHYMMRVCIHSRKAPDGQKKAGQTAAAHVLGGTAYAQLYEKGH